jgi:hypothetical protein
MAINRVTGTEFDGSCINITIAKTQIPFISISYGDNVSPEWIYQMGNQIAVAQSPGQYKPDEGKLKMRSSVARVMLFPNLPQFGAANARTQAVVNYIHPDVGSDSDLLVDFRVLGSSASLEASAKGTECELKCSYRLIKWTSKRICFGATVGGGATGTLRL